MIARAAKTCAAAMRFLGSLPVKPGTLLFAVGIAVFCHGLTGASAQSAPVSKQSTDDPYAAHIAEASHRFRMPERWIRAIMRLESARDPVAVSRKGAVGLMQVMPATFAELRLRHHLGGNPFDPRDNILAGTAYLRELFDRYGSPGFLAAYNAGPGRYEASLTGRPLPAETRSYVAKLRPFWGGGDGSGALTAARRNADAWTAAPLFTTRSGSIAAADRLSSEGALAGMPASPRAGDLFSARSRPRELFSGPDVGTSAP
ncbi:MAG: lytic transglycosylase domain-containing protein [Mesorhizobium sp.]